MMRKAWAGSALAVTALAGCAVDSGLRLDSSGPGFGAGASYVIDLPEKPGPDDLAAAEALRTALGASGLIESSTGRYRISMGLAQRPAAIGLARNDAAPDPDWISPAQEGYPLDRCKAGRLRVTMVVYEPVTSRIAYRGSAEQDGCRFDSRSASSLARALATDSTRPRSP